MRRIVRSRYTWVAVACLIAFWVSASFIPNPFVIIESNSLLLCSSIAVARGYTPIAVDAVRDDDPSATIALGIAYAWGFGALWRMISLFWLMAGQNPILVNNDLVAMVQAGVAFGALHHLKTVRRGKNKSRRGMYWREIAVVVGASLVVSSVLIFFRPDLRWVVPYLEPYIPR